MSRYRINSSKYSIDVGYDQPLRTFFAVVEDHDLAEAEDQDSVLLWVNNDYDEIRSIAELANLIAKYCSIPYEIMVKLEDDSVEPFEPSYVQSLAEHLRNQILEQ